MKLTTVSAVAEQRWNDAALARPKQKAAWRLWRYRAPAIVLGRAQQGLLAGISKRGEVDALVRAAGGGAVLVGPWMLGLTAWLPTAHPKFETAAVPSYRWLGEAIAQALQQVGIDAAALSPEALQARRAAGLAAAPDWSCFGGLSPWEVLVGARKIAGLAQVRQRHGVLLVAGILLQPPPWTLLCEQLGQAPAEAQRLARATTNCADERAGIKPSLFIQALSHMLTAALGLLPCSVAHRLPAPRAQTQSGSSIGPGASNSSPSRAACANTGPTATVRGPPQSSSI